MNSTHTTEEFKPDISAYLLIMFGTLIFISIFAIIFPEIFINKCNKHNKINIQQNNMKYNNPEFFYTEVYFNNFNKTCSICLSDFKVNESIYKTDCGHYYHKDCILKHFSNSYNCPMCRKFVYDTYEINLI